MKSSKDQVKLKHLYNAWNVRKKAMNESLRLRGKIGRIYSKWIDKPNENIEEFRDKGSIQSWSTHEKNKLLRIRYLKKKHAILETLQKIKDDILEINASANVVFCKEVIKLFGNKVTISLYPKLKSRKTEILLRIKGKWINLK